MEFTPSSLQERYLMLVHHFNGNFQTPGTLLVILPYLVGLVATVLNGGHSDRTRELRWHTAGALFLGGAWLTIATVSAPHIWIQLAFFILFAAFIHAYQPTIWRCPPIPAG
jgi:MFS transporter, ACS family, tartrate transporter